MASNLLKNMLGMGMKPFREELQQNVQDMQNAQYTTSIGIGSPLTGTSTYNPNSLNIQNGSYGYASRDRHFNVFSKGGVQGNPNRAPGMTEPISACALLWITKFGARWVSSQELLEPGNEHFAAYARRLYDYKALEAVESVETNMNTLGTTHDMWVRLMDTWEMILGVPKHAAAG